MHVTFFAFIERSTFLSYFMHRGTILLVDFNVESFMMFLDLISNIPKMTSEVTVLIPALWES